MSLPFPRMGLGCMSLSHAYGVPPSVEDGVALVRAALDAGVGMLDTATLYGEGGESVGALAELVDAGKIGAIGLSEVSVTRLREAQAVASVAAVQNEYSLWSRNPELGMLEATRETGVALVAFSPVARGFLADAVHDPADLAPNDIRRAMPRFQSDNWAANAALLPAWRDLAAEAGCTPAQLALAWLLSRGGHVVAIPGTTDAAHLRENLAAADLAVDAALLERAGELIDTGTVSGPRYPAGQSAEVDAESFEVAA